MLFWRPCRIYAYSFNFLTILMSTIPIFVCTGHIPNSSAGFMGIYLPMWKQHIEAFLDIFWIIVPDLWLLFFPECWWSHSTTFLKTISWKHHVWEEHHSPKYGGSFVSQKSENVVSRLTVTETTIHSFKRSVFFNEIVWKFSPDSFTEMLKHPAK